jgi:membrane protein YdbS with pleckstrin-like domain|tara:strand:+ start:945 stop:1181 length:237 start_codon:yes stop_codon:yes gene_type:complete
MFKRVISHQGFWKSVVVLSLVYAIIMYVIQWGLAGRWSEFFSAKAVVLLIFIFGSFLVGFLVTYGKFWRKLKEQDYKK